MYQFTVTTFDFTKKNFAEWKLPYPYYYVYILENGKEAYIGQTKDQVIRMKAHDGKKKQYSFQRAHSITSKYAEETPAKHFENLLIMLMKADGRFEIVNPLDGEQQNYYRKNDFEEAFDRLWPLLAEKQLVKERQYQMVLNKSSYKYAPPKMLTAKQKQALDGIVNELVFAEESLAKKKAYFYKRPIIIEGDAGTGKTVLATSLFYYLKTDERFKNKKIGMVYACPSMRSLISSVFKEVKELKCKYVIKPTDVTREHYDILICDEAQKLRKNINQGKYEGNFKLGSRRLGLDDSADELDWVLHNSTFQVLFFDEKQAAGPADIPDIKNRLLEGGIRPVKLEEQMRILAGEEYVPYIYDVLFQKAKSRKTFEHYEFRLFRSFREMFELIRKKERETGLCRLGSGYAWEWNEKDSEEDIVIDGVRIKWNGQTGGWLNNLEAREEMGSIYTLQGLDLNYAGIVIGRDLYFDENDGLIKVNEECFYDKKVKKNVPREKLKEYILNTYAVLLSRGIRGTYVYVCDENLRTYLEQFIPNEL